MKSIAMIAGLMLLAPAWVCGAEPKTKLTDEFLRPFPVVAIPANATAAHKAAAKEVAEAIGAGVFLEGKANPVCCVWLEITHWTPNPGEPGYIIINQPGGSVITASNEEQLRAAVARFKASIRKRGDEIEVPAGLLTNFHIAKVPAADQ